MSNTFRKTKLKNNQKKWKEWTKKCARKEVKKCNGTTRAEVIDRLVYIKTHIEDKFNNIIKKYNDLLYYFCDNVHHSFIVSY